MEKAYSGQKLRNVITKRLNNSQNNSLEYAQQFHFHLLPYNTELDSYD